MRRLLSVPVSAGPLLAVLESGVDPDYAAFERAESRRTMSASDVPAYVTRRKRQTLAELPSMPVAPSAAPAGELVVETAAAHEAAPVPRLEADPLAHLRAARFGFALAAVLVLYGLWLWQRRRF